MKTSIFLGTVAAATLMAGAGMADTLADVKARGELNCGVNTGLVGFAAPDANGNWTGFDVDFCKAVAAAVLGDATKVKYVPTTGQTRFTALSSGEVDILARNSTWTFQRDTDLKLDFIGVNYYDGQGFMVREALGVNSALQLSGATVCVQSGTTTELNLADYFRANNLEYNPVVIESQADVNAAYDSGRCDALTTDASGLYASRLELGNPDEHIVLPEIISKEPLGPAVRQGDEEWFDIVRWTLFAMLNAEELGVTSANVEEMAKSTKNPDVARLLGAEGEYGKDLRLPKDWAVQIVKQVGNYGEIFDRNVGAGSELKIERGLNALWNKGGLQYAPPVR